MPYLILPVAAIGHVILWMALVNRLHGFGIHRRSIDLATGLCGLALVALPMAFVAIVWQHARSNVAAGDDFAWRIAWWYASGCALLCGMAAIHRIWLVLHRERSGVLLENHTTRVDVRRNNTAEYFAPGIPALLGRLPGNQALDLHVHEKQLVIPRLGTAADGLRIAHITDLHMSGRITKAYFEAAVERVNQLQPDLVAVTGDLVERDECLDWLPDTLGLLRATSGVFFVLGNHDRRVDQGRLAASLAKLPLVHLGGCWRQVAVRNTRIVLAGNELPWYGPAPNPEDCPKSDLANRPLRILLSHGPDQLDWAVDHDFDLVLAGHNHGGQVRLPAFGAILAPSRSGTRYAGGVFRRGQTVMHVSRGTSSLTPFRWNCPPEIALLILRAKQPQ
ncbi:MAG TPA: metallophosphoesterase [Lacipirellulaceae bacterium]|jgi:hypothetical protein